MAPHPAGRDTSSKDCQLNSRDYLKNTGKAVWVNRSKYKETKKGDIFYLVYINNKLAGHYPTSKFELP